ncbi:carboxypeptidase B-like [Limulus polyphemus]|uniref:Carboxypeptidase B-like n=1 Tax=Limulus polyphemus TaxID=6850 RepID=A0ABM1BB62_LIMPO|nr:carboxypeptidase B-like [Limulus polyphemus]
MEGIYSEYFTLEAGVPQGEVVNPILFIKHKVIGAFASSEKELDVLRHLRKDPKVDFWNEPIEEYEKVSIHTSPDVEKTVLKELSDNGIDFYIITDNLKRLIEDERNNNQPGGFLEGRDVTKFNLDVYHNMEEINIYIEEIAKNHDIASIQRIGTSVEGNSIVGLKIGSLSTSGTQKQAVWIDAGIHAREWAAPATALYLIHYLVNGYGIDEKVTKLINTYDWYIFPVVNPDGYKYTWNGDRMWRKNRSLPPQRGELRNCLGVDINRNFDAMFGGKGTTDDICSDIYRGESAFSEPETRAIRDAVLQLKGRLKAYFTLHSYSQLWMCPYGHSLTYPLNYNDQFQALHTAINAVWKKHGKYYKFGSIASVIYPAAGSSIDWVYDNVGANYSIALELRDRGEHGFFLPRKEIIPTGEETWAGIEAMLLNVSNN